MDVRKLAVYAAASLLAMSSLARADEIIFKNGDRLTGKIESAVDGKLVITSKVAGKLTVSLKDVKTFSTDAPAKVKLDDGTVIDQKIAESQTEGDIATAPGGVLQPQPVPIASISKINQPDITWTGAVVINGLFTRGNTSTDQIGISANVERRSDDDRLTGSAGYLYGRSKPPGGSEATTEDNEFISGEYDYFFTKKFYGYLQGRAEKDRINNLDLRLTPGAGIGYQWVESPDFNFNTTAGGAWVYEKFTNVTTAREDVSVRLAYHIDKGLWSNHLKIFHDLQYLQSVENGKNFIVLTDVGIHADLTDKFFSEFKAIINYDSQPAPGAVKTDTKFLVGVGYTF